MPYNRMGRGARALRALRALAPLLAALAVLGALGCSDDGGGSDLGAAPDGTAQDGGAAPGQSGSGGRGASGRGAAGSSAGGSSAADAGTGAASCVPAVVSEVPELAASPSNAIDRVIELADAIGTDGSLVADGAGGAWLLAREGNPLAATATGSVLLLHYGADGQLVSQHALRGGALGGGGLSVMLIGGSEPRLVGTYDASAQLGPTTLGDGSAPGLFVATLADSGPAIEAQLRLAVTAPGSYRVATGARDSNGRVLLGVLGNTDIPELGCPIGELALLGFDSADVALRGCVTGVDFSLVKLAPDAAGGAYVSLRSEVVHVDAAGATAWRFSFETTMSAPTLTALAAVDDGVVLTGMFSGRLQLGGETLESDGTGRSPLLFALRRDGSLAWTHWFAARGMADPASLLRLQDGSLLIGGTFDDALYVGDGVLLADVPPPRTSIGGHIDAFLLHTDAQGVALAAERAGSAQTERAVALAEGSSDDVWWYLQRSATTNAPSLLHVALDAARMPAPLDTSSDPFVRIAAPAGFEGEQFGQSLAVDGDLAVVGRTLHVIWREGDGYTVGEQLERPADATAAFAQSLALSARVLAVADPALAFDGALGRVYVYARDGERFAFEARVQPSAPLADNDDFGRAIALVGETLFVASQLGVHVFERDGTRWLERDMLAGPSGSRSFYAANAELLATDGERLFVGMPNERVERPGDGAVYVYAPRNGAFVFEQRLVASDPLPFAKIPVQQCTDGATECGELSGRGFGAGLAVDADRLIVGADHGEGSPAELYVFARNGTRFDELGKLRVHYVGGGSPRGMPLALLGERLVLGSPRMGVRGAWYAGSAELLPLTPSSGDTITTGTDLHSIDPSPTAGFGSAFARIGADLLIGAPGEHGGQLIAVHLGCDAAREP